MKVLSVSELNEEIRTLFDSNLYNIIVKGEVSNCTYHTSGHVYFTLKDKTSTVRCVIFKNNALGLKFKIKDGLNIIVNGSLGIYSPRGDYQIICKTATEDGIGNLQEEFLKLKKEYEIKGYFDSSHKKEITKFPKIIALLTSKTGDVVNDMRMVAQKRGWNVKFVLINTKVQGNDAKYSISNNIKFADTLNMDCIILARGGGSIEDLWPFNEKEVAEAIFQAKTPIISAIGHEPDYVLSDYIADLRAPTPSAAISMILPDIREVTINIDTLNSRLQSTFLNILKLKERDIETLNTKLNAYSIDKYIERQLQRLDALKRLLTKEISNKVNILEAKLKPFSRSIDNVIKTKITHIQHKIETLLLTLESKNPQNKQKKGYVYVSLNNKCIDKLSDIDLNSTLILEDLSASLEVIVKSKKTIKN